LKKRAIVVTEVISENTDLHVVFTPGVTSLTHPTYSRGVHRGGSARGGLG